MTVPKVKEGSIAIDTLETVAWWLVVVVPPNKYNARKIPEVIHFCVVLSGKGPKKARGLRGGLDQEVLPGNLPPPIQDCR